MLEVCLKQWDLMIFLFFIFTILYLLNFVSSRHFLLWCESHLWEFNEHYKDKCCYVFCLQLVFDMLVLQKHNTEMTVAAGEALYTLVCLHQVRKHHRKSTCSSDEAAGVLLLERFKGDRLFDASYSVFIQNVIYCHQFSATI